MTRTIWLASYPKSGNTWFRMLVANLSAKDGKPVDINDLPERGGIASARGPFDYLSLIDSGLLTHDEIDCLRPRVYEELARGAQDDEYDKPEDIPPVRFVKVHDAYTLTPKGEPLLAGRRGADGAIVIVRDPRDVAPSLANHNRISIDDAITLMNDRQAGYCAKPERLDHQLRQKLPGWSGHIASWLDQTDIPVHLDPLRGYAGRYRRHFRRALDFAGRPATDEDIRARGGVMPISPNCGGRNRTRAFPKRRAGRAGYSSAAARLGAWRDELTRRASRADRSRTCADDAAAGL